MTTCLHLNRCVVAGHGLLAAGCHGFERMSGLCQNLLNIEASGESRVLVRDIEGLQICVKRGCSMYAGNPKDPTKTLSS